MKKAQQKKTRKKLNRHTKGSRPSLRGLAFPRFLGFKKTTKLWWNILFLQTKQNGFWARFRLEKTKRGALKKTVFGIFSSHLEKSASITRKSFCWWEAGPISAKSWQQRCFATQGEASKASPSWFSNTYQVWHISFWVQALRRCCAREKTGFTSP